MSSSVTRSWSLFCVSDDSQICNKIFTEPPLPCSHLTCLLAPVFIKLTMLSGESQADFLYNQQSNHLMKKVPAPPVILEVFTLQPCQYNSMSILYYAISYFIVFGKLNNTKCNRFLSVVRSEHVRTINDRLQLCRDPYDM